MEKTKKVVIPKIAVICISFCLFLFNELDNFKRSIYAKSQILNAVDTFNLLSIKAEKSNLFTLSAEENSAFKALVVAQMLLAAREVDAVLVGAVDLAGAVSERWQNS